MEDLAKKLAGAYYIATTEGDQPHVRPFDNAAVVDGNLYIGTSRGKNVFAQIVNNPKVEIFAMGEMGAARFTAEAHEETDEEIAKKAYDLMGKPYDEDSSVALKLDKIINL